MGIGARSGHNLGTGKYVYSQLSNGVDGIPDPIWAAYSFTETELVVHNIGDDGHAPTDTRIGDREAPTQAP